MEKGTTKLISRANGGGPATGGSSTDPSISGNGRWVAFESDATNLPGNLSPDDQVYLRDRKTGTTRLVGQNTDGTPTDEDTEDPSISPNGRIVGFESEATNLPGGATLDARAMSGSSSVTELLVSRNTAGDPADDDSTDVTVSGTVGTWSSSPMRRTSPGRLGRATARSTSATESRARRP